MRGRITTEHTVWCHCSLTEDVPFRAGSTMDHPHGCASYHQTSEPRPAAFARSLGWIKTRAHGWICPPCARVYEQLHPEKLTG